MTTANGETSAARGAGHRATILVVDDEPAVRRATCRALSRLGHVTESAENGAVALELALRNRPAVVVTDMDMPAMGGRELAEQLRERLGKRAPALIVLTGSDTLGLELPGQVAALQKPFVTDELLRTVQDAVARHLGGPGP